MQFKYPEILWALTTLIIPILIHLFQLRKFQKVPFTNVHFLKEITIQTRKSSELKKWLVLLSRLLALAAAIIAFAQPYFANRNIATTAKETVIYLDNSFSMQLKGAKGPLLNRAIQELISSIPEKEEITLFTNNQSFPKSNIKAIQNQLLQLPYTDTQLTLDQIVLKGQSTFNRTENSLKKLILISDFQRQQGTNTFTPDSLVSMEAVKLSPIKIDNISLDSIYISKTTPSNIELSALTSVSEKTTASYPVSLFNGDKLIAKVSANFQETTEATIIFTIPANTIINGKLVVEDEGLMYDNTLYFNFNASGKINVLAINEADDNFLTRIFTNDEFNLTSFKFNELNYSSIENQNLIVLNELNNIPNSLTTALKVFHQNGGSIIHIPSEVARISNYNQFYQLFTIAQPDTISNREKKITKIQFSHPVYQDVFDKEVQNFQYPKTEKSYHFNGRSSNLLLFEDGSPFLFEKNKVFVFTSPLNKLRSNFKNSPLIVPTFYSIAKKSLQLPKLYYSLGVTNQVDIKTSIENDAILNVVNEDSQFIPLQQSFPNKVSVSFTDNPKKSGIYSVKNNDVELQNLSFNYIRNESDLQYLNTSEINIEKTTDSVRLFFEKLTKDNNINELWKWFVTFALIFLIVEMLLLKFLK